MDKIIIYHNPRCSKSRATLALLEENDINPEIIYYLENPPRPHELTALLKKLDMSLNEILRKSEAEYEDLGLGDSNLSEEIVLDLVCKHPILIQRPIVVRGERAVLGRPPENIFKLTEKQANE